MGGKSRKSGGVSQKLIQQIKSGASMSTNKTSCCGKKKPSNPEKSLFEKN